MSTRRRAEIAVIEAAHQLCSTTTDGCTFGPPFGDALDMLAETVQQLEAVGLETPTGTPVGNLHPATAHQAAESMRKIVGKLTGDVFQQFLIVGDAGLTADAVQARLHGNHQSISPRVSELADKGWVVVTGLRRRTRSGRWADVYRVSDLGRAAANLVQAWTW